MDGVTKPTATNGKIPAHFSFPSLDDPPTRDRFGNGAPPIGNIGGLRITIAAKMYSKSVNQLCTVSIYFILFYFILCLCVCFAKVKNIVRPCKGRNSLLAAAQLRCC
jgi:hypothetical protein